MKNFTYMNPSSAEEASVSDGARHRGDGRARIFWA